MFFQEAELFQGIAAHIIDEVAGIAVEETRAGGTTLFEAGDFADSLFILVEGSVDITISGPRQISFPVTEPGSVFGWSSLVEPNLYTASARCLKESKVIRLDGARLMRIFENHPAGGLTVMKRLAGIIARRLAN
ncbi:MAG: hypothetical protein DRH20_10455, partial [Deltaproteobacteria bacterium]